MTQFRTVSTLAKILTAIVDRLAESVPGLTPGSCYIALNPDSVINAPGSEVVVVSPSSGEFDAGAIIGGGAEQMTVSSQVIVKIHSPIVLDQASQDTLFLVDATHGVLVTAGRVMQALAGWTPQNSTNLLTRDPLWPTSYSMTRSEGRIGGFEIVFNCVYDWEVTEEMEA